MRQQVTQKRFKQMMHPCNGICRGNVEAVWHFEHITAEALPWVKWGEAGYKFHSTECAFN